MTNTNENKPAEVNWPEVRDREIENFFHKIRLPHGEYAEYALPKKLQIAMDFGFTHGQASRDAEVLEWRTKFTAERENGFAIFKDLVTIERERDELKVAVKLAEELSAIDFNRRVDAEAERDELRAELQESERIYNQNRAVIETMRTENDRLRAALELASELLIVPERNQDEEWYKKQDEVNAALKPQALAVKVES